jgi:hypothetical protein
LLSCLQYAGDNYGGSDLGHNLQDFQEMRGSFRVKRSGGFNRGTHGGYWCWLIHQLDWPALGSYR